MSASLETPQSSACPDWLVERIRCLFCHNRVELKGDGGGVRCVECGRVYPIRDGILVLMAEEAVEEGRAEKA
jgi:uncharacterized protein YbaR (Trm112 family)